MATIVDCVDVSVIVYLNDIVVYGTDPTRISQETEVVLERLACAGFMVNTAKSHFLVSSMKMLGYELQGGRRMPSYS